MNHDLLTIICSKVSLNDLLIIAFLNSDTIRVITEDNNLLWQARCSREYKKFLFFTIPEYISRENKWYDMYRDFTIAHEKYGHLYEQQFEVELVHNEKYVVSPIEIADFIEQNKSSPSIEWMKENFSRDHRSNILLTRYIKHPDIFNTINMSLIIGDYHCCFIDDDRASLDDRLSAIFNDSLRYNNLIVVKWFRQIYKDIFFGYGEISIRNFRIQVIKNVIKNNHAILLDYILSIKLKYFKGVKLHVFLSTCDKEIFYTFAKYGIFLDFTQIKEEDIKNIPWLSDYKEQFST